MKVPFLDLQRGYRERAVDIDRCMQEVAASGAYVLGPHVSALEQAVAEHVGTRYAVGVGSGTDALHLALAALDIGPGDEVITTPFTFAATVEAIEYVGAQPVLVDGQAVGSFGHAGAFSFYPTKILGGTGDGGLISTDDPDVDRRLRELRNHGIGPEGEHIALGFNSRLDELQAAILRVRLKEIDAAIERRRQIAAHYDAALSATAARLQPSASGHVYGYYTILVDDRDGFRKGMAEKGIATAVYYPKPLHLHEHFGSTCRFTSLPAAEEVASSCVSLPIFPEMTDAEVDYVASASAALLS